jgi:hypothetical protein
MRTLKGIYETLFLKLQADSRASLCCLCICPHVKASNKGIMILKSEGWGLGKAEIFF